MAKMACAGQAEAIATLMRRTLGDQRADLQELQPDRLACASASSVPASPSRRSAPSST